MHRAISGMLLVELAVALWSLAHHVRVSAGAGNDPQCPHETIYCGEPTGDDMPCCMTCYCSQFCWARDDCCVDAPPLPPADIPAVKSAIECVPSSHEIIDGRWAVRSVDKLVYVPMISKCVGTAQSHPLAERCPVAPDDPLISMIPIWSNATRDVYRNIYCAACYNVEDIESFQVNIGALNDYFATENRVNWDLIDYVLKHSTSNDVFLRATPAISMQYHVQLCQPVVAPCKRVMFNWSIISVSGRYASLPTTFTALLSFVETPGVDRRACGKTQILDPYMDICRPLICPELSTAYNGDCFYTGIDDTPRTVSFRLTVAADDNMFSMPLLHSKLMFKRFLYFCDSWCTYLCDVEIAINESLSSANSETRDYFMSVGFQNNSKEHTNMKHVKYANELLSSSSEIVLGVKIKTHLLKGINARQYQYSDKWRYLNRTCKGEFHVIKIWCPTLELSESDFRYAVANKILPETFEFNNPYDVAGNQTVARQLCSRDYLQAWMDSSSPARALETSHICLLLLCCSTYIYIINQYTRIL